MLLAKSAAKKKRPKIKFIFVLWYTGLVSEYKRNPNTKCLVCDKPIYRRPAEIQKNEGRVFCSASCYGINLRKEIPCGVCGKMILSGLNKKTCSRSCANKHRTNIKYKIGRPKSNTESQRTSKSLLLKNRGKKCENCGYNKYQILQIHHKNKNRENNGLENLELLCPNCHAEKHYLEKVGLILNNRLEGSHSPV